MILKKVMSVLMVSVMTVALLVGCGADPVTPETPGETPVETPADGEMLELTLAELAEFDGKDGNKAYIAIDGNVYDVTDLAPWAGGMHNDYPAGKDYTKEIKDVAPHGLTPLEDLEPVGKIVE